MKLQSNGQPLTTAQVQLLQSRRFLMAELFTFQYADGQVDTFTNLDVSLTIPPGPDGVLYKANAIRVDSFHFKLEVGTNVDEQSIKVYAYPGEQAGGGDFMQGLIDGAMDSGYVVRDRAVWAVNTGVPSVDYLQAPYVIIRLSQMRVSTVTKAGRGYAEVKLKSPLVLLNTSMPRNYYGPQCIWTLYDQGCGLTKALYGSGGTIGPGNPAAMIIPWNGGVPVSQGADGFPYYAQGRLLFTSGALENVQIGIASNDDSYLYLTRPVDVLPSVGDAFIAYAGCSKTLGTCTQKFNNTNNWRAYDNVPPVFISL